MSDTPITDAFEQSCATATAIRYKKELGEKANLIEIEFVLALENSRRIERENAELRKELDALQRALDLITGYESYKHGVTYSFDGRANARAVIERELKSTRPNEG